MIMLMGNSVKELRNELDVVEMALENGAVVGMGGTISGEVPIAPPMNPNIDFKEVKSALEMLLR